jgi:hypothetical protein
VKNIASSLRGVLVAVLLVVATVALSEDKGPMYLTEPTQVGRSILGTGNYKVRWEDKGEQVELKIYQGKKEVATVPAHLIQLSSPAEFNSAVVQSNGGTRSLSAIHFQGKKLALQLRDDAAGASSSAASR